MNRNQNSNKIHEADDKPRKTRASETRLALVLLLNEKMAGILPNQSQINHREMKGIWATICNTYLIYEIL